MALLRDQLTGKSSTNTGYSPFTAAHRERRALYDAYWSYYRGKHRRSLRVEPGAPDDNVVLNLSKRIVNKGIQFLFGKAVDFEIDADNPDRTPEEQYLDLAWGTDAQKHTLLQSLALNGAVCGQAVVRLYAPPLPGDLPRIVNLDPAMLDVVTLDDDVEQVSSYRLIWRSGEVWRRHRIDLQANDTWIVNVEEQRPGRSDWQLTGEELWPYPFAPVVTCQNLPLPNVFWGMSDLEDADLNDSINFVASNINRILRFHSHPKTVGTGFNAQMLQNTAVDAFWTVPDPQAKVYNLEMQSDLASAYNYLAMLRTLYAKVTGVPELDPAQVNVGALSGFALRILYGDLLEATQTKRNTYGHLLAEVNARLLALGNVAAYGTLTVNNVWADPLPDSGLEQAQTLEIDRRNGLSQETYLTRRGYDPEIEEERKAAEQEAQGNVGAALMAQFERGGPQFAQPAARAADEADR